ncbi:MAG: hypothetical protein ACKOCM_08210, partial [Cyanobacteriota bacterium]
GNDRLNGGAGADRIEAGDGDDRADGGLGNDSIQGGAGSDTLLGDQGDDLLEGDAGNDRLEGGIGADSERGGAGADTLLGDAGADLLEGGDDDDVLVAGSGAAGGSLPLSAFRSGDSSAVLGFDADILRGGDGNDLLAGNAGANRLEGDSGNDTIAAGAGADTAAGGGGDDLIYGEAGNDLLHGHEGNDQLHGGDGDDRVIGDAGMDRLYGDQGADILEGGDGDDQLWGGADGDLLRGSSGNDVLDGDDGNDSLEGGSGDDSLSGDLGNDLLQGGLGADLLRGEAGNERLQGDEGNDQLEGGSGRDTLEGGVGNDQLSGGTDADNLFGGSGADTLDGNDGADLLRGETGNDRLSGDAGSDTLEGGAGEDRLEGGSESDLLMGGVDDDQLQGGDAADWLFGDEGNDLIEGNAGDDRASGGAGADVLRGGTGNDQLEGGGASDELYGDAGDDLLSGSQGADELFGGTGDDLLIGGSGKDQLVGEDDDDWLFGDLYDLDAALAGLAALFSHRTGQPSGSGAFQQAEPFDHEEVFSSEAITEAGAAVISTGPPPALRWLQDNLEVPHWSALSNDQWRLLRLLDTDPSGRPDLASPLHEDRLQGSAGNDWLYCGSGPDLLEGGTESDLLLGGTGNDVLYGYQATLNLEQQFLDGDDALYGGDGNDELWGGIGHDFLAGGRGNDKLVGDDSDDPILITRARPGQDYVGRDLLAGGHGNDTLFGALGTDVLFAGEGLERADRGNDAADSFRLYGSGVGSPSALEFLLAFNNTPTNVRSLGFDRLVGGIDSDIIVGHRLRPVRESELLTAINNWTSASLGDVDGDGTADTALSLIAGLDNLSDDNGIRLASDGSRGFVLNRRSSDGVVVELAPGAGTDLVWNFYAGSHDGTRRRLGDSDSTAVTGELYTLDLNATQVGLVDGGTEIVYDLDLMPVETDVVYLTAGLSFGSIDLQWRSWSISDLTNQLLSDLGDDQAIQRLRQYVARNDVSVLTNADTGSGIDGLALDWGFRNAADFSSSDPADYAPILHDPLNRNELWIALSQSYAPNQLFNSNVGVMSLIDRDTDQVLARFLNVSEDAIGRHNIDEQNVPPDRLVAEPGKAVFSASERVTVPEGMARDPNGATDLAAIEARIRRITAISASGKVAGSWQNWRGLGLLGTRFGSSQWFDLDSNADDGLELLITSGGTIQERIDLDLPIWGIDLDGNAQLAANGVYGAAALQIRDPNGLLPAYQNELVIAAERPLAVTLNTSWTVEAANPLGTTPLYNALGYTTAAGTYAWRNDLVWLDGDGDGRLTLPLTNRIKGTAPNQEPAGPFDQIRFANPSSDSKINHLKPGTVKPLQTVGDVVEAGGWELVEELFYAGEPTSEAATGRVVVSINTSIPGSALYLNTTRAEDLDGDGQARFDEAGTGFREITVLSQGVASASSPQVVGGDPSRDRRYPGGLKAQLNPSFSLVPAASRLSHRLLQAGWRDSGAGNLSFEAWGYNLQAQTAGPDGRVVDLTGTPATALRLQIPSANPSWRNDSSLAPLWSFQNDNAEPDLLLGNWLWLDPGTASSPVVPIQLVPSAAAERSEQVSYSPLQSDWGSVVLESTGWPLRGEAPLWAFLGEARDGSQDSFSRLTSPDGGVYPWEGQYRQALLPTTLTPQDNTDVIALQVSDLASTTATIQATGAINRLQDLRESGVVHEHISAQGQLALMAGLNGAGIAEFRITDARGLPLARVDVAGIKRLSGVGWFSPERAWA